MTEKSRVGITSVRRRYCAGAFAGILAVLPGVVSAQDWWVGIWTGEPEWCAAADRIGSVTPAPIGISATEVLGYENSCAITEAREVGDVNAALLKLECQSEGEIYSEQRIILKQGEDAIWIWWGNGEPILFTRCKG